MEIKSDESMLEWFLINVENGLVCINAQINDSDGTLQFSPTKRRFHPSVRAGVLLIEEGTNATATNASERAINATATIPSKKKIISTKKKTVATKKVLLRVM